MTNEDFIYHYTTHEAAFSILAEQKLRLSNLHHLNDRGEYIFTFEYLGEYIKKRIEQNDQILNLVLTELENYIEKIKHMRTSICVACFSTGKDDAAQWYRYAKRGEGVCISFKTKKLQEIMNDKHGNILPVKYGDEDLVYTELDSAIRFLESQAKEGKFLSRTMADPLPKIATFIKAKAFDSEKEFRLAMYGCGWPSYKFSFRDNSLIPYIELPITLDCVSEVILGPLASNESRAAWELNLDILHRGGRSPITVARSKTRLKN